jgi:RNA-directed DNA polymerase
MDEAIAKCASSNWHEIDWNKVNHQVKKLQIRIVKATKEKRWNKVKALQNLLTHSFSGKALAIRRITENQGKRTAGVDGEIWSNPKSKSEAIHSISTNGYRPKALKRVYIPKGNGKKRPLGIPTMRDRAMQALFKFALEPVAETTADFNSYGFRPERSTTDAISKCFQVLSRKDSSKWVLEGDIKGCFDNISHRWLVNNIPMDKKILTKWLKAGYMEKRKLFATNSGTPQGGIISPILSNITLDGIEEILKPYKKQKVNFVRYADDFIVTGVSKELLENEVKPLIESFLKERGLSLSEEKTKITHINKGFDFLGVNIRKYKEKLLIKPSKDNVKAFLKKIRELVKSNKAIAQVDMIRLLNPVIMGWSSYHRYFVSKGTFSYVASAIFKVLWQWSKRRHNNKNHRWIKRKYFKTKGKRNWVFLDEGLELFNPQDIVIRRHIKIKGEANPFDPEFETYFEKRLGTKMVNDITLNRRLRNLWKEQSGKCLICKNLITKENGWNIHHLIPKVKGGTNNSSNLVLLHPYCHIQLHNQDLTVRKPSS